MDVFRSAFRRDGFNKWRQCAEEAMNCCNNMNQEDLIPGTEFEIKFKIK
jgi:hypothetical protein